MSDVHRAPGNSPVPVVARDALGQMGEHKSHDFLEVIKDVTQINNSGAAYTRVVRILTPFWLNLQLQRSAEIRVFIQPNSRPI